MTRRRKSVPSHILPPTPSSRHAPVMTSGLLVAIAATLLLGGIPFALGKYIELNSPDPFDGGAYIYSAQRILNGARLWVDEQSSARPGTLLCNILGVKLFGFGHTGPVIIQMLLQLGGLATLFYTARRLFGNLAAVVSTALAAVMLSAPVIAKYGNVKEQFMIPFCLVAACAFILHETSGKKRWAILAGAAAIIPYYFKPTGVAVIAAMGVYWIVKLAVRRWQWKSVFRTIALWVIGAVLGLCVPAVLYIWQGAMARFWRSFPVVLLEGIILFSALAFAIFAAIEYIPWSRVPQALARVPQRLWSIGGLLIALALLASVAWIALTQGTLPRHDIPSYLWSLPFIKYPIIAKSWLFHQAYTIIEASGMLAESGYVGLSRQARPLSEQAPQVWRYYHAVGAVFYPALATVLIWVWQGLRRLTRKHKTDNRVYAAAGMMVLWWLLDTALVWVSPHSYEQYYLPMCASGAALFGYAVWRWSQWYRRRADKIPPLAAASAAGAVLAVLVFPVFAGYATSPDTGNEYKNVQTGRPERRRGFAQSLATVHRQSPAPWQQLADYIRTHSTPDETIYVWGWYPGIYVQAERTAPVPRAFEAEMHITPPDVLARHISTLVSQLQDAPPRYIVDTRKQHFPFDGRPPLELWPIIPPNMFGNAQARHLANDPREIEAFEHAWSQMLAQRFGQEEAQRFAAMKPFRDFVMTRYRFVQNFGYHMLYEYRPSLPSTP